jgi:hypothetical protein
VVVFAIGVMPDLENHGTEATAAPSDSTKLFRIVVLLECLREELINF